MEIADSARKHDIPDEDILHGVAHPMGTIRIEEDRIFFIGATRTGDLLELIVIDPDEPDAAVIHADICRPKFYRYLI